MLSVPWCYSGIISAILDRETGIVCNQSEGFFVVVEEQFWGCFGGQLPPLGVSTKVHPQPVAEQARGSLTFNSVKGDKPHARPTTQFS